MDMKEGGENTGMISNSGMSKRRDDDHALKLQAKKSDP